LKVEPQSKSDLENLPIALRVLTSDVSGCSWHIDPESREIIVGGQSEMQLDLLIDSLIKGGIKVNVGAPQVAYRETIARAVEVDYEFDQTVGGSRQAAQIQLRLEPGEFDEGLSFDSASPDGTLPSEYMDAIRQGVSSACKIGFAIGFPVIGIRVTLMHFSIDAGTAPLEFVRTGTSMAMKDGFEQTKMKILEPVMDVEVTHPSQFTGNIIGDINGRRGQIAHQSMKGDDTVLRAYVPLANMFGYASDLRALAQGQADYIMTFSHYAEFPRNPGPDTFPPAVGMRA
jgi:elongation factor G